MLEISRIALPGAMACLMLAPPGLSAQQAERETETSVSLGYVGTTGNTKTRTFNTEVLTTLSTEQWSHRMKFQSLASTEDTRTRAERYYLENKSDFNLGETDYAYLKGTYTDDRFSGYNYQFSMTGGYGRHFYDREDLGLEVFSGVGYRFNELNSGEDEDEVIIFSLGEDLEWQISESTALTQSFTTDIGQELTTSKFEIGLTSEIMDRLSTKIAFQARNISDAPPDSVHTDTQTSINLVYDF